uniref:Cytochrome b n=1 Tax=Pthirus pubis TaxID=121228 RepID=C0ILV2_PTHPU|nr:cytochrome b [Pthirus pubis]
MFKVMSYIPTPSLLSYSWNFGSLLGCFLVVQVFTGFLLSTHYEASLSSFESVLLIEFDALEGWLVRSLHANGASWFFILAYFHIWRSLWFGCFSQKLVWVSGILILLLMMAISFLGYVLPWGQMSFWGATVITNLFSALPFVGSELVTWIWGGFSVGSPTLERFFSSHFMLSMVLLCFVIFHITFLHENGSSNPLGLDLQSDKVYFYPYFMLKDLLGGLVAMTIYFSLGLYSPDLFMDPDNFMEANPLVTPPHIQPEWYFLFAYAILRAVPSKLGGVVALVMSIVSLVVLLLGKSYSARFSVARKVLVYSLVVSVLILSWLGAMPAEVPFVKVSQVASVIYFTLILLISL